MARTKIYDMPRFFQDGIAYYPMKGHGEPPPDMEGYRRRGTNPRTIDAWIFIPLWQDCPYRNRTLVQRDEGCRCVRIVMVCTHPKLKDTRLNLSTCQNCQLLNQLQQEEPFIEPSNSESVSESVVVVVERDVEPLAESTQPKGLEGEILTPEDSPILDAESE